jgi:hypothetical protein
VYSALIFWAEPAFAAAWAWAGERLGPPELTGWALILAGMLPAQYAPAGAIQTRQFRVPGSKVEVMAARTPVTLEPRTSNSHQKP